MKNAVASVQPEPVSWPAPTEAELTFLATGELAGPEGA